MLCLGCLAADRHHQLRPVRISLLGLMRLNALSRLQLLLRVARGSSPARAFSVGPNCGCRHQNGAWRSARVIPVRCRSQLNILVIWSQSAGPVARGAANPWDLGATTHGITQGTARIRRLSQNEKAFLQLHIGITIMKIRRSRRPSKYQDTVLLV